MKKINKKISFVFLAVALVQILLLVGMTFAESYQIHQTDTKSFSNAVNENKNRKNILSKGLTFIVGILAIKQIQIVSAVQDATPMCCLQMANGLKCQDIMPWDYEANHGICLDVNGPENRPCEDSSSCKPGCCFDTTHGTCDSQSPEVPCESNNGYWEPAPDCEVIQCQKGCCVIGNEYIFQTEKWCEYQTTHTAGINEINFMAGVTNELDCLALKPDSTEGACVYDKVYERDCRFITADECTSTGGTDFYKDYLCSNEGLDTTCVKEQTIGCVEGKDGIYWFDSCGNRENIYEGNKRGEKESSWNEGIIKTDGISCTPEDALDPSEDCGNCNFMKGSLCKAVSSNEKHVEAGNFVCQDLTCHDAPISLKENGLIKTDPSEIYETDGDKQNGESWCVYEGQIGSITGGGIIVGMHAVGSEQWKFTCNNGVVQSEMCGGYRSELCQETIFKNPDSEKEYSTATCVPNDASICVSYTGQEDWIDLCNKDSHCIYNEKFGVCTAKYPKGAPLGFELQTATTETGTGEAGTQTQTETSDGTDQNLCGIFTGQCYRVLEKQANGDWKCVENCDECGTNQWFDQANDACVSLGDCKLVRDKPDQATGDDASSLPNLAGKNSDGIFMGDTQKGRYWNYWKTDSEQKVEPYDDNKILESIGVDSKSNTKEEGIKQAIAISGGISGGLGVAFYGSTLIASTYPGAVLTSSGLVVSMGNGIGAVGVFSAMGIVFLTTSIGLAIGYFLGKALGIHGDAATWMMVGGGLMGLGAGLIWLSYTAAASAAIPIVGWIVAAIGLATIITIWAIGWGKQKQEIYTARCVQWQPPMNSDDCDLCNADPLRPCTPYRCASLGMGCEIPDNADPANPQCVESIFDPVPPTITWGEVYNVSNSNEQYDFFPYENKPKTQAAAIREKENGGTITESALITFSLNTSTIAQCKFATEHTNTYSDMPEANYPLEGSVLGITHTFQILIPRFDELDPEDVNDNQNIPQGESQIYVRCVNKDDVSENSAEYVVDFLIEQEPDLQPVDFGLVITEPENGAYVSYDATELDLEMWINEPADCKWDKTAGMPFENMANNFDCPRSSWDRQLNGYLCTTTLTGLTNDENKFYFKCKDQPWLNSDPDGKRNTNTEDYEYILKSSSGILNIDSTSPTGTIFFGGNAQSVSVNISAQTSGGVNGDGVSVCSYNWNGWNEFFETNAATHKQNNLGFVGNQNVNIPIKCVDDGGNSAEGNITFKIQQDNKVPIVVRIYKSGNSVSLITNEDAQCYYNNVDSCIPFHWANATSISTGFSKLHSLDFNPAKTYYVKCKDIFGNQNDPFCAAIIKSTTFG